VKVAVIYENYAFHYLYMTPGYYREIFGTDPDFNASFVKNTEGYHDYNEELSTELLGKDTVGSVSFLSTTRDTVDSMLGSMDVIIAVLVVCAGALAFIVLYNLNNVNIAERRRELATLKVLGFYDGEVSGYIYRENIIITIMGIVLGAVFGKYLHLFVMVTAEIDSMMFGRSVKLISYIYSILLTILFAIIINLTMHFKLKKVDMATSLKSVE
jgi:putative ABC transport system permease protein